MHMKTFKIFKMNLEYIFINKHHTNIDTILQTLANNNKF